MASRHFGMAYIIKGYIYNSKNFADEKIINWKHINHIFLNVKIP